MNIISLSTALYRYTATHVPTRTVGKRRVNIIQSKERRPIPFSKGEPKAKQKTCEGIIGNRAFRLAWVE